MPTRRMRSVTATSALITWMLRCHTLVPALVIPREAGHELLHLDGARGLHFPEEVECLSATKGGGQATVMAYFHVAGLRKTVSEAKLFLLCIHGSVAVQQGCGVSERKGANICGLSP